MREWCFEEDHPLEEVQGEREHHSQVEWEHHIQPGQEHRNQTERECNQTEHEVDNHQQLRIQFVQERRSCSVAGIAVQAIQLFEEQLTRDRG